MNPSKDRCCLRRPRVPGVAAPAGGWRCRPTQITKVLTRLDQRGRSRTWDPDSQTRDSLSLTLSRDGIPGGRRCLLVCLMDDATAYTQNILNHKAANKRNYCFFTATDAWLLHGMFLLLMSYISHAYMVKSQYKKTLKGWRRWGR